MKKLVLPFFAASFLLLSCESEPSNEISAVDGDVVSSISSSEKSIKELEADLVEFEKEEKERLAVLEASESSLEFDRLLFDFGNVEQGSENTTEFTVKNTGTKPLIIQDVSASCGCTLPKKPEKPIPPGKTDVIKVTFKPKEGQKNEIRKTVTVTANTSEKIHKIEIRAFVM